MELVKWRGGLFFIRNLWFKRSKVTVFFCGIHALTIILSKSSTIAYLKCKTFLRVKLDISYLISLTQHTRQKKTMSISCRVNNVLNWKCGVDVIWIKHASLQQSWRIVNITYIELETPLMSFPPFCCNKMFRDELLRRF